MKRETISTLWKLILRQPRFLEERRALVEERDRLIAERNHLGELRYQFEHERDIARGERDEARIQRDLLAKEIERLSRELDSVTMERNELGELRYRFEHERDVARAELDRLRRGPSSEGLKAASAPCASDDGCLIFLHIAKTGGATLGSVLNKHFRLDEILLPDSIPSDSALGLSPLDRFAEKIAGLNAEQLSNTRLVAGHLMFGIHKLLPGRARYLTLLRHPVDRVVSSYHYILHQEGIPVRRDIIDRNLDLEGYIESGLGLDPHNYQTRVLAGLPEYDCSWADTRRAARRAMPRSVLELAKRNIEQHFAVVGVTERFDEFLLVAKLMFQWPLKRLLYNRLNETPSKPKVTDLDERLVRRIEDCNQLDLELYNFASKRFEAEQQRWRKEIDYLLPRFQAINRLYALDHTAGDQIVREPDLLEQLCDTVDSGLSS